MRFLSTSNPSHKVSFVEAVTNGLAPQGGLYIPEAIPQLSAAFLANLHKQSLPEIGIEVARNFLSDDFSPAIIQTIVEKALTFDAPLVSLSETLATLELFHGPTFAFKDFGARFLAQVLAHVPRTSDLMVTILVATSGDTGGAVADGFYKIPGVRVVVLYPRAKVTPLQESQFATLGENIFALEVDGVFDDCQRLVKEAFCDTTLQGKLQLSSANSINIARLLPQTFYYFRLCAQTRMAPDLTVSVPSGNFGNLTAGVIAKRMGAPIRRFVAATNVNDTFTRYLETGRFEPKPSQQTLSNAMDVGNPNNFPRLLHLYANSRDAMRSDISSASYSDLETQNAMRKLRDEYNYIADPHGAVAYLGLQHSEALSPKSMSVFLETAHPAKFHETVTAVLERAPEIPPELQARMTQPKLSIGIASAYQELRDFLVSLS